MDSNSVPHFYFCCHYLYLTQQLCLLLQFVPVKYHWETSLVAQTVKRLPTVWEAQVQSLGREDLLEKEMATRFSIFAWKILWTEEPGRLQSMGSQKVGHDWVTSEIISWAIFEIISWAIFPGGSDGKASAYNAGGPGSIPGSGRSPGEGNGNPLQYSCLENPMDGGAC